MQLNGDHGETSGVDKPLDGSLPGIPPGHTCPTAAAWVGRGIPVLKTKIKTCHENSKESDSNMLSEGTCVKSVGN